MGNPVSLTFAQESSEPSAVESVSESAPDAPAASETSEEDSDSEAPSDEASITTGDAVSESDVINEVNSNVVDTEPAAPEGDVIETPEEEDIVPEGSSSGPLLEETAPTTEPVAPLELSGGAETATATASTTVSLSNEADVENAVAAIAETGDNTATGTAASAIETGDALASANVINVVNSNIINSNGFLLLLNWLFGTGSLDLRDLDFSGMAGSAEPAASGETVTESAPCSLESCGNADYTVTATNTASISNTVLVRAETGGNTASGGSASVTTGNAYASANVVNVANTNIVDSNYLLLAFNNFGSLNGDIVFPGLSFFEWFLSSAAGLGGGTSVSIDNGAAVSNTVSTVADTGGNTATSSEGGAEIATGDALAQSSVSNIVNTNLLGGKSLYILLNVHGNWSGNIFGLPPGLSWAPTPSGIVIYSGGSGGDSLMGGSYALTNSAAVNNDVQVYALTGANRADGGSASIATGDAFAAANVFNLVNTNVVGQNWLLAALNIMGDWNGNLSFGRPDLWIGGRAESPHSPMHPDSPITFHFTVSNLGDAEATGVVLHNAFDDEILGFDDPDTDWELGTLAPGETREISVPAHVMHAIGIGDVPFELVTTAALNETDDNPEDNTETLALLAQNRRGIVNVVTTARYAGPDLEVVKTSNVSSTTVPGSVEYTIDVYNHGTSAYDAELLDTLKDEEGGVISEQGWSLGEILPDEHITVSYTVEFNEETVPGTYTNEAQVLAEGVSTPTPSSDDSADSNVARSSVSLIKKLPTVCGPYLTTYMRQGAQNDPAEVLKLQTFLREIEGFAAVLTTSVFDAATEAAVRAFQDRYADDVLTPWGATSNTGYVYYTTQKKINEIYCNFTVPFALTSAQVSEIENFKARIKRSFDEGLPLPDTGSVGLGEHVPTVAKNEEEVPNIMQTAAAGAAAGGWGTRIVRSVSNVAQKATSWVSKLLPFRR